MNEALTRWKLLTFTHTKDLQQAVSVKEVVTQKELMVIANPPRFLREGDEIEFSAKVSNLSKENLAGTATLSLLDAATLQVVEREFGLAPNNRVAHFNVLTGQSAAVSWRVKVPDNYPGAVTWQIHADGKAFRDGEENTIPVVSNRMLVTETLPISVRGNQTKKFVFENLKNKGESASLQTHSYTLEFTSNPVWYAVQSLPYLMDFPHECSEQIFSRFYANTLASSVVEKMPQIKRVYDRWKGTEAMKSNLSKNQELKSAPAGRNALGIGRPKRGTTKTKHCLAVRPQPHGRRAGTCHQYAGRTTAWKWRLALVSWWARQLVHHPAYCQWYDAPAKTGCL